MCTKRVELAPTRTPQDWTRAWAQCTVGAVEKGSFRSDHTGPVGNIARNIDFSILKGVTAAKWSSWHLHARHTIAPERFLMTPQVFDMKTNAELRGIESYNYMKTT